MTKTWDDAALDAIVKSAGGAHSTDLVIVHRGTTLVERVWPVDARTKPAVHDVLEDGRPRQDVASAQKSVVSVLIGIAVGRGLLRVEDPVRRWLGAPWPEAVTLRHLLTMTAGLAEDLTPQAEPGERWDYNLGAAYHSTKRVLCAAADATLSAITREWLTGPVGMADSHWVERKWIDGLPELLRPSFTYPDGAPVEAFVSTGRDLARFAETVRDVGRLRHLGADPDYARAMLRPSQDRNPAYGLLWWVNGGDWALAPKRPERSEGRFFPGVPADAAFALGMGDRMVAVVPSLSLSLVRLGAPADAASPAGSSFLRALTASVVAACPSGPGSACLPGS